MTQLEMMTSTELSGSGMCSISPFRNSTFSAPAFLLVLAGQRQHLVGHVEAVGLAAWADATGREQDVDAAARSEIEHGFSRFELGKRRRISTTERSQDRSLRQFAGLMLGVEIGGDRVAAEAFAAAGTPDAPGSLRILLTHGLLDVSHCVLPAPSLTATGLAVGRRWLVLGGGTTTAVGLEEGLPSPRCSIGRALAHGMEGLPGYARRVGNPALLRLGIAAGRHALFDHRRLCLLEAAVDFLQFARALDLNAEMAETRARFVAGGDREVHARILE